MIMKFDTYYNIPGYKSEEIEREFSSFFIQSIIGYKNCKYDSFFNAGGIYINTADENWGD